MRCHFERAVRKMRASSSIVAVLLLCSALRAEKVCTAEIKLLISPSTIKSVITSMRFGKKAEGRVYLFDTDDLSLLRQRVILRVRQGAKNDLTVKVRLPVDDQRIDNSTIREHFGCEIDRTKDGVDVSFSVGQKYRHRQIPETGDDIFRALSSDQRRLLQESHASINWTQVRRTSNIESTTWEAKAQPQFPGLSLELWEWPDGSILELSARVGSNESESKLADLEQLANAKGLSLSANQRTKTSLVLKMQTH